jgi:hypothetical protein
MLDLQISLHIRLFSPSASLLPDKSTLEQAEKARFSSRYRRQICIDDLISGSRVPTISSFFFVSFAAFARLSTLSTPPHSSPLPGVPGHVTSSLLLQTFEMTSFDASNYNFLVCFAVIFHQTSLRAYESRQTNRNL